MSLSTVQLAFLDALLPPPTWPDPQDCQRSLERWRRAGAQVEMLGSSTQGAPLRAVCFGTGPRTLLAWGYPHPDEPLGAGALLALGEALVSGEQLLPGWRCVLVLCADPDQAARQCWLKSERAADFVAGCWRPAHLGLEVDYGFPLDYGPFLQEPDYPGRCRFPHDERCPGEDCAQRPYPPLPESLALAAAIDRYQPELVAAMHSSHSGGDYTFLLQRERPEVLDALLAVPARFGRPRHRGEPIDRGRRWRRDAPDLLREPDLAGFVRRMERRAFYDPDYLYAGNHSAAAYLASQLPEAQFVCPEAGQFTDAAFADTSALGETRSVRERYEVRPRAGLSRVRRVQTREGDWVIYEQERVGVRGPDRDLDVPVSRGMLGVLALVERRGVLAEADALWERARVLDGLAVHPYAQERSNITVPGAYVSDGAMRIFRLREDYRREATVAQAACLRWRWPLHTATLLGNFRAWLAAQDLTRPELAAIEHELAGLQARCLAALPPAMEVEGDRAGAMASMLARVFVLANARSGGVEQPEAVLAQDADAAGQGQPADGSVDEHEAVVG